MEEILENSDDRGPGRPRLYERKTPERRGAPTVTVRFAPAIHQHVMSQPGGARVYLERLINEDIQRTRSAESDQAHTISIESCEQG